MTFSGSDFLVMLVSGKAAYGGIVRDEVSTQSKERFDLFLSLWLSKLFYCSEFSLLWFYYAFRHSMTKF